MIKLTPSHCAAHTATPEVEGQRLGQHQLTLAGAGASDKGGGCRLVRLVRLVLGDLDHQGRELFTPCTQALSRSRRADVIGKRLARRDGRGTSLPAVAVVRSQATLRQAGLS